MTALSLATIREAPKVLLHDHLDGGVRPQTVIDLAAEQGYDRLPTTDPDELAAWFVEGAARRSLPRYLEPFEHTVGVMQTAEALTRIAAECAEDLADDGVVYAEIRFAPELHLDGGLDLDEVVAAVLEGFEQVTSRRPIQIGTLLAINLDIDEQAVHDRGGVFVLEAFMGHDMAPVAGGITDRQQDRLVFCPGTRKCGFAPRIPVDGIVSVLQKIGAGFVGQKITGHDMA